MSDDTYSKDPPPPLAADITAALDADRLDYIFNTLSKASLFCAAGALAAEAHDVKTLAIRTRLSVVALKEACLIIAELGCPEVVE